MSHNLDSLIVHASRPLKRRFRLAARDGSRAMRLAAVGTVLLGLALPSAALAAPRGSHSGPSGAASRLNRTLAQRAYGHLPISFEVNRGQTDPQVAFLVHAGSTSVYLTASRILLSVPVGSGSAPVPHRMTVMPPGAQPRPVAHRLVGMTLLGASRHPRIVGTDPLPGKVNYFIGNNPKAWHINIPTYAGVLYRNIYPGIDLQFHGTSGRLEYDWVVHPGADPAAIRLLLLGAGAMRLDTQGNLVWGSSRLLQRHPTLYQGTAGHRIAVAGHFVLRGNELRLAIGQYDRHRVLVIDPTISPTYSTLLGGGPDESGRGIVADSSGNAYVAGYTDDDTFPTTTGQTSWPGSGNSDECFVLKLNPSGTALVYSTYLGGSSGDQAYAIAVDSSGDAYVTGWSGSSNFPTTTGAFQTAPGGGGDAFVTKLNNAGSALLYSTYLGGSGGEGGGQGIALDGSGDAYVTGQTTSTNFPTHTPFQSSLANSWGNAFVSKLNPSGTALVYSTYLGGSGNSTHFGDASNGIAVDGSGEAFVTGSTTSSNFPTASALQSAFGGNDFDAFVSKFNASGTGLVYSTYLGGSGNDHGLGIAVDGAGDAYVTGNTGSSNFPTTPGAFEPTLPANTGTAAFVSKISPGGGLNYSTFVGGKAGLVGNGSGQAIAVDGAGDAYVTGDTVGCCYNVTANAFQSTCTAASRCAFETTLSANGSGLLYSTFLGGNNFDMGNGISVDPSDNVYVTGQTQSSNFPTTPGAFNTTNFGSVYGFVTKFPRVIPNPPSISAGPNPVPAGSSTTINWNTGDGSTGQLYVAVDGDSDQAQPLASASSGSYVASFITAGHTYVFRLYAGTTHTTQLSAVIVTVAGSTSPAAITAGPDPVPAGSSSTTINWNTGDGTVGQVYVAVDGDSDQTTPVASGASGSYVASFISPGHTYVFRLYASTTHTTQLAAVIVTVAGSPSPASITAGPGTVPAGSSRTAITWNTGDGTSGQVYVAVDGDSDQSAPFASGASGTIIAAFINPGHTYVFKLYAGSSHTTQLASAIVINAGGAGPGAISAGPNPVTVPAGQTTGRTAVTWNTGDGTSGQVYVSVDGDSDQASPFANGAAGSIIAAWITPGHTYIFRLFAGTSHTIQLAAVIVTVASTASLPAMSASPDPVAAGSSRSAISWNTGDGTSGQVFIAVDGGADQTTPFATGAIGTIVAAFISPGHTYTFKLYAGTAHSSELAAVIVTTAGSTSPAVITAGPNPVPAGSTNTVVSWNTGSGTSGQVFVSVDGGADQTTPFASGVSGAIVAAWINPGHTYTFKLYAGTSHTTKLAQVTVSH